jgi:hypothetical protein
VKLIVLHLMPMKKILSKLMLIAPGRIDIQIDQHKLYNETALQVIERRPSQYGIHAGDMIIKNTIIRVEVAPITKPMPTVVCYHYDLELALKNCLDQINLWKP